MSTHAAGVVVSLDDELYFVPAKMAEQIVERPVITRVPGTAIGIALIGGRVVTVIDVGPRRDELLLCTVEGELVAVSGLSVRGSGFYPSEGDGILVDGQLVPGFNLERALVDAGHGLLSARRGPGAS